MASGLPKFVSSPLASSTHSSEQDAHVLKRRATLLPATKAMTNDVHTARDALELAHEHLDYGLRRDRWHCMLRVSCLYVEFERLRWDVRPSTP
jgi:hypothetical protein